MSKPNAASGDRRALFLTPESPYPMVGGGQLRAASLLQYLIQHYTVDVIAFRQPNDPDPRDVFPPGLVRRICVLDLPFHSRSVPARAVRNGLRLLRNRPPLLDRFSGFNRMIETLVSDAFYDVGIVEHFWCAPYIRQLRPRCRRLIVDLVDIESVWHARAAETSSALEAFAHNRFASAYGKLERSLLPQFDELLVTSAADAAAARFSSRNTPITIYPNALPELPLPDPSKQFSIAFSGNLEYQPNISAVSFFHQYVWPILRDQWPGLVWEIIGRNPQGVARIVAGDDSIRLTGPVPDALAAIARSQVAVVPVLAGSGTRVKILEAWAAATPVVSTTIGAEGLDCVAGEHILIADAPLAFAIAVSKLLESAEERSRIGHAGRRLYQSRFTWKAAWRQLTF